MSDADSAKGNKAHIARIETPKEQVLQVHTADPLLDYLQDLVAATRSGRWFLQGLSPRAGIAVIRAAKAQALLSGRDYVAPDDFEWEPTPHGEVLERAKTHYPAPPAAAPAPEAKP